MQDTPEIVSPPNEEISEVAERLKAIKADRRWFGIGIFLFVMVVGMVGGVAYYQQISKSANQLVSGKASHQISMPVESVRPVEQQSYTVDILNGSGVTGSAAKAAEILKSQMTNSQIVVTTGNALMQAGTSVFYQKETMRRSNLGGIISTLYPEAKVSVDESLEHSVKIIIGK